MSEIAGSELNVRPAVSAKPEQSSVLVKALLYISSTVLPVQAVCRIDEIRNAAQICVACADHFCRKAA